MREKPCTRIPPIGFSPDVITVFKGDITSKDQLDTYLHVLSVLRECLPDTPSEPDTAGTCVDLGKIGGADA